MATVETLRPDNPMASGPAPTSTGRTPPPQLSSFRSDRSEDRLADLLAYALAVEAQEAARPGEDDRAPPGPEAVELLREQAQRELHDHAFRFLHNRVEEIRAEAVADTLVRHPKPPGFLALVLANLLALAIAGVAADWLHGHPDLLGRILEAVGG